MWILLETVTTLTAAEILALNGTPVEIAPDPGDGNVIVPVFLSWDFAPVTTPYSIAGSMTTAFGGGASAFGATTLALNATTKQTGYLPAPAKAAGLASANAGDVKVALAAPVTTGDGTLRITFKYYVHDVQ